MTPQGPVVPASERWLVTPRSNPAARLRLICLASAGHGPAMYRPWLALLPPDIELAMAHLPGRESRWSEPPIDRLTDIVGPIRDAVLRGGSRPYALFGHSLGALIAFEVARAVRRAGGPLPVALMASAHRAPHLPLRFPRIARLDNASFVEQVNARHGGIPEEVAGNQELMELMVPSLKADYRLFEDYEYVPEPPLACPVVAFGGSTDRYISEADLTGWAEHTASGFAMRVFDGGHFFVNDARPVVAATVVEHLNASTAR